MGIDLGLTHFAITTDGFKFDDPKHRFCLPLSNGRNVYKMSGWGLGYVFKPFDLLNKGGESSQSPFLRGDLGESKAGGKD